jgi:hypothetical protein
MSSDNYYLVRRVGERFLVSMEFASNDDVEGRLASAIVAVNTPRPIESEAVRWFDSESEAVEAAGKHYAEYGVVVDVERDASGDTFVERLAACAVAYDDELDADWEFAAKDGDKVVVGVGPFEVTISAKDGVNPGDYADWLVATTPRALAAGLGRVSEAAVHAR